MNDLISRQAAIDALMEKDKKLRNINWYDKPYAEGKCEGIDEALSIISNLPSAQSEIIRCEDCRYANECHKSVQYTRNEPNMMTIGYSPIEWCSKGEKKADGDC